MSNRKRFLVTGSSKGIGKAIAIALAAEDREIVVHYRSDKAGADDTAATIRELGGKALVMGFDIANRGETVTAITKDIDENVLLRITSQIVER